MKRILVVDDIAENRYLLEAMLQAYGYEVTSANDGAEALAAARHQPPDLVISDILMPVMDGFTLCKHWRAEAALHGVPFIFYTATYTDARDEQLAMDLGADRFVLKPQEPQVMHAIIQDVLSLAAKLSNVAEATTRPADETVTLREYNEVLVRKLEKKVAELEATRVTSDAELRQRHHIEEALRRSDERWRLIYETEPECVKVVSADGRLLSMNPAGLAMIDAHSLDDVCGRHVIDLVTPEHREAFLAMHRDVLAGQTRHLVFEVIGLNGRRRWLETHEAPLTNEDGTVSLLGITRDITDRNRANEELKANRERLEVLSRQLIAAQETERRHLARELHDEIGQALTAIKLNLKALQQPVPATRSGPLLQETIGVVDQTLKQVRSLALDLRPSMLDDIGLVAALRWCLDRQSQRASFTPQFVADSSVRGASPTINTACFRIVQECLTNIARHAKASNVRVELRQNESDLELFVADDGIGFDIPAARHRASSGESIGLLGMEERVQLVGGQIEIVSNPSGGTTIHAWIPLTGNSS